LADALGRLIVILRVVIGPFPIPKNEPVVERCVEEPIGKELCRDQHKEERLDKRFGVKKINDEYTDTQSKNSNGPVGNETQHGRLLV
jgi:hypothetical protein